MDEEEVIEGTYTYVDLELDDGDAVTVDATYAPMLKEWTWRRCPTTLTVVRTDDGSPLYTEMLRWHQRKGIDVDNRPHMERAGVRMQFGGHPEFRRFVKLAQRQRDDLLWSDQFHTPVALDVLAMALAEGLSRYFAWRDGGTQIVHVPDLDGLTPGLLAQEPIRTAPATLGAWLALPVGGWRRDLDAATGLVPRRHGDAFLVALHRLWRQAARGCNYADAIRPKAAEAYLRDIDRPILDLLRLARTIVGTYPLPPIPTLPEPDPADGA